jgi:hypothetical protein
MQPEPRYYAVKCLRKSITEEECSFETGAIDLALEAKILEKLCHPNIIHLHSSTAGCISEAFRFGAGFFLPGARSSRGYLG